MLELYTESTSPLHPKTKTNNRIDSLVTAPVTVRQMCRQAPATFQVNWPNSKPTQTLEQWAAL